MLVFEEVGDIVSFCSDSTLFVTWLIYLNNTIKAMVYIIGLRIIKVHSVD